MGDITKLEINNIVFDVKILNQRVGEYFDVGPVDRQLHRSHGEKLKSEKADPAAAFGGHFM